jgi:beta-phosphoglucomutase-like phosphatase (HAD superfamily)
MTARPSLLKYLDSYQMILWDFDGVIKDSVEVKSLAFEELFKPYGEKVVRKIVAHHESHGGMSRFEKIPLYLSWAGVKISSDLVRIFCNRFSQLVSGSVVESPWMPGVYEYLNGNQKKNILPLLPQRLKLRLRKFCLPWELTRSFGE